MNPFKTFLACLFGRNLPFNPTNTVRFAFDHLDERCLPSVSPLAPVSAHIPLDIKQVQVHLTPLPATETSNPNAIGVGHHWEVTEALHPVNKGSKLEAVVSSDGNTVRFFE
jgi:hypothetical protein